MVWPWPPSARHHDPVDWVFWAGRYDYERWGRNWQQLFDTHELVHNRREIRKVVVTPEQDGAFAVVDVDTLWRDREGREQHWQGRACKVYSKVGDGWKMTMHTGLLDRDGHQHTTVHVAVLAERDLGDAAPLARVARVRDARERDPGDDRVV